MSVTVTCPQTLRFGLSGTATLWSESDLTVSAASDLALSAPADTGNQKRDAYIFTTSVIDGLYFVQLIETGATDPFWSGYVYIDNALPTATACDFRETALTLKKADNYLDRKISETATPGDLDSLRGSGISFVSPMSADGKRMKIVTGDSYTVENGQSFRWRIEGRPELIGCVPHLRLQGDTEDLAIAPALISGTQDIIMDNVPSSRTDTIKVGDGTREYQLRLVKGADKATTVDGIAQIIQGH